MTARRHTFVFILGAPRSGTTWLQQLLGSHPDVVSPQELHLANAYLRPLYESWNRQLDHVRTAVADQVADREPMRRPVGLPTLLSEQDIDEVAAALLRQVWRRATELKPGASVLVEKSPTSRPCVDLLNRAAPQARFIHLVRDPRFVVASLLNAHRSWGSDWAPANVLAAAFEWRGCVARAREAAAFEGRFLELKYEDLRNRTAQQLRRVLDFCGVDADEAQSRRIAADLDLGRQSVQPTVRYVVGGEAAKLLGEAAVREPTGFVGKGAARSRPALSSYDEYVVEKLLGRNLDELGYPAHRASPPSTASRFLYDSRLLTARLHRRATVTRRRRAGGAASAGR